MRVCGVIQCPSLVAKGAVRRIRHTRSYADLLEILALQVVEQESRSSVVSDKCIQEPVAVVE